MAPLQVVFLSLDPDSSSARVRVGDHLPALAALGVKGELRGLPRGAWARRRLFARLGQPDVVVLHRLLLAELELVALRRRARALALDLDDAIYLRPHGRRPSRRLGFKFHGTLRAVDLVLCGSLHLRDELRAAHPRVRLLPPASPPAEGPPPTQREGPLRLVWTGSRATLPYLESLGPVLAQLGEAVELTVVADAAPRLPRVRTRFVPWSLEAESQALREAEVGLYPLSDDAWSRGKCAYKLRRYMMHGLPSVASPQGGGAEVLEPPEAGLVAGDPEAWRQALQTLAADPQLRARMGLRARALAWGRDALGDRTRSLARILHEAAAIGRLRAGGGPGRGGE